MKNINEFFKQKTENLSFIELKPNSFIDVNGYKVGSDIPLPMTVDELVTEVKEQRAQEELKITSFIEGMIYTMGVDPEFKYFNDYKKIIYSFDEKIEDYILYKGLKFIEKGSIDEAMIYFRALVNINKENVIALYNYALSLEEKAKKLYKVKKINDGNLFLNESTRQFEDIIDLDPTFAPGYYKLGFHYRNSKQFRKSQIMWEKLLDFDDDDERIGEIKKNLQDMEDDVQYEEGYLEVLNGNAEEGLKKLLPLEEKYTDWWNLLFMIGLGYRQLGQYNKAKDQFEKVLAMYPNQVESLNELGLCLAVLNQHDEAISKFTQAIENRPNDFEILCNRGMTYLEKGDMEKATKDIEKAYSINPEDQVTISCKRHLEKIKD